MAYSPPPRSASSSSTQTGWCSRPATRRVAVMTRIRRLMSGLARAFFYAGARALLVSHWYVDSRAAVKLTTSAFAELERNPQIGRAEAFRRAMLATMNDTGRPKSWTSAAHPAVWAPIRIGWRGWSFRKPIQLRQRMCGRRPQSQAKLAPSGRKTSERHLRQRKRSKQSGAWDWLGNF